MTLAESSRGVKAILHEGFAAVAKAAAHPHRLALLEQLAQGERSVDTLAERVGLSITNTSQHLQMMRRAGLLAARRDGKFTLYRLADDSVLALVDAIGAVAERNVAEVKAVVTSYFNARDDMEPVSRRELRKRMASGAVTVLDVRTAEEFALGHIPGAVSMPTNELRRRLSQLPRSKEIVAYCRGRYCVFAFEAVAQLRAAGYTARRLEDGLPHWRAAGLPVETGQ
ncbi:MAG: metalloregulator ArsR/SmtB family transcription factor [Hydrogenophilaceae bacterium]|jgi:ArsR family transcriptional regulator|nr:metalloregulator ArsR/SmtB family transcription factor [Hydrogenophilaceae bacterium]